MALIPTLSLPIEWLPVAGAPQQLIVLLHGWASNGNAMAPLAQALRTQFPQAAVLAPEAPHLADTQRLKRPGQTARRQWYPVAQLTAENWPDRVGKVLPGLQAWVLAQQQRLGVAPAATCLGGFSQGAILSLALAVQHDGLCGRVLSFGGCLVGPPMAAPRHTTVHLLHGSADQVIPAQGSRDALEQLAALQGDATLDIAADVAHELHPALINCALKRLQTHIPLRTWKAALGAIPTAPAAPAAPAASAAPAG